MIAAIANTANAVAILQTAGTVMRRGITYTITAVVIVQTTHTGMVRFVTYAVAAVGITDAINTISTVAFANLFAFTVQIARTVGLRGFVIFTGTEVAALVAGAVGIV